MRIKAEAGTCSSDSSQVTARAPRVTYHETRHGRPAGRVFECKQMKNEHNDRFFKVEIDFSRLSFQRHIFQHISSKVPFSLRVTKTRSTESYPESSNTLKWLVFTRVFRVYLISGNVFLTSPASGATSSRNPLFDFYDWHAFDHQDELRRIRLLRFRQPGQPMWNLLGLWHGVLVKYLIGMLVFAVSDMESWLNKLIDMFFV